MCCLNTWRKTLFNVSLPLVILRTQEQKRCLRFHDYRNIISGKCVLFRHIPFYSNFLFFSSFYFDFFGLLKLSFTRRWTAEWKSLKDICSDIFQATKSSRIFFPLLATWFHILLFINTVKWVKWRDRIKWNFLWLQKELWVER